MYDGFVKDGGVVEAVKLNCFDTLVLCSERRTKEKGATNKLCAIGRNDVEKDKVSESL